jgi:hypothetical protein
MKEIIKYSKQYKNKNKGINEQLRKEKKEKATNEKA